MNGTRHHEVGEYLRRLQRAMGDLPDERRDEILAEIEEHIAELLARHAEASDADVRNVLERVGDPQEIAAEARERFEITPVARFTRPTTSLIEIAAVTLLVLGSVLIILLSRPEGTLVAWVAAIVLLWMSEVWRTRDKTHVTLVVSTGALGALMIPGAGDEGFVYFAIILFAAIWPPAYLGHKLRKAHLASDSGGFAVEAGGLLASSGGSEEGRRTKWLMGGVLALVVLVGTVVVSLALSGGADESFRESEITEAQFDRVSLGDAREDVSRILGGPGDGGSIVAGLDPAALEEPEDVGDQQFDDCWSYSVAGAGPGSEASVCFDSSDEVAYTRLRISTSP